MDRTADHVIDARDSCWVCNGMAEGDVQHVERAEDGRGSRCPLHSVRDLFMFREPSSARALRRLNGSVSTGGCPDSALDIRVVNPAWWLLLVTCHLVMPSRFIIEGPMAREQRSVCSQVSRRASLRTGWGAAARYATV
jgi:hypothetical protein